MPDCSDMGNRAQNSSPTHKSSQIILRHAEQSPTSRSHASSPPSRLLPIDFVFRRTVRCAACISTLFSFAAWPNRLTLIVSPFQRHVSHEGGALFRSYTSRMPHHMG